MTEQQLLNEFKVLETGSSFISEKMGEFAQKYPRQFVAVKDNQLIATGKSFGEVMIKVKEKNIEPSLVLIEYIPGKEEIIFY